MRMYRCVWSVQAAIVLLACVAPVHADGGNAEQAVRALEQRWLANEGRPEVVATILADDFVHVLPVGFVTKRQHLEYLQQHPGAFSGDKRFKELHIRVYGVTAIATGIVSSEPADGGKPRESAFTDVFVRRSGKWLAVNAQELALAPAR
jgi:Domain of unknown function (DUF4440)